MIDVAAGNFQAIRKPDGCGVTQIDPDKRSYHVALLVQNMDQSSWTSPAACLKI